MFKYSLVAVAMIFIAVACNKKEEAAVEAAPAEQTEVAVPAAEVAPTEAAPADAAAPTEAPAEAPAQ